MWSEVKVAPSFPTLCDRMDYTVHGILQARILAWVAFPFPRGSSQPRNQTQVSHIAAGFFTSWATREAQEYWCGLPIPSPADLSDPGTESGSPALQVDSLPTELSGKPLILEWVAYPFSSGSSQPRDWTGGSCIAGRFFTNWAICVCICIYLSIHLSLVEIYHEELAHVIMEAGGPPDLLSASWRPGKPVMWFSLSVTAWEPGKPGQSRWNEKLELSSEAGK